jgi:hypothetical protein
MFRDSMMQEIKVKVKASLLLVSSYMMKERPKDKTVSDKI